MFLDNAKYEWNWMKWLNLDLPNLTSIISYDWYSFKFPRSVTLESILKYWISIWSRYSESSNCQDTLRSFLWSSKEINIEYCLIDLISFIDVSSILADLVQIKHWFQYWIYIIDLFPFHSNNRFTTIIIPFNTFLLTLFVQNPFINIPSSFLYHSIIIWLFSINTNQIGLASMFQSIVWSMLRMN